MVKFIACPSCAEQVPVLGLKQHRVACERVCRDQADAARADQEAEHAAHRALIKENFQELMIEKRTQIAVAFERARISGGCAVPGLDELAAAFNDVMESTIEGLAKHTTEVQTLTAEEQCAKEDLEETAKAVSRDLTAKKRRRLTVEELDRNDCKPVEPRVRVYGRHPVRKAKKKKDKDTAAHFQAVVVDLPLEEQVRLKCRDPDFAKLYFSTREGVPGEISDWWDCDLADVPHVDPNRKHNSPFQAYTGACCMSKIDHFTYMHMQMDLASPTQSENGQH